MDKGLQHCTGGGDQNHPLEKEMQKRKMVVWGGLTIADKRREAKGKGEKIYSSECTVPKNTKERLKKKKNKKKPSSVINAKK